MAASVLFEATATGISFASRYASRTLACGVSVYWTNKIGIQIPYGLLSYKSISYRLFIVAMMFLLTHTQYSSRRLWTGLSGGLESLFLYPRRASFEVVFRGIRPNTSNLLYSHLAHLLHMSLLHSSHRV